MIKKIGSVTWEEPNRAAVSPLHIGARGQRESTITGVAWLDDTRFVANHRNGKRVALFDLRARQNPVAMAALPNLTDSVHIRHVAAETWELVTSDCWEGAYTRLQLTLSATPEFELLETVWKNNRTFCHGATFGPDGRLWLAMNTGLRPRIEIAGGRSWTLPEPWGCRSVCFDGASGRAYAVACSNNPKREAYAEVAASVWMLDADQDEWTPQLLMKKTHTDAGAIYKGRIWINDQHGDQVLGLDLARREKPIVLKGEFSFPHGIAISPAGVLAVTNYGTSSITLIDLSPVPDAPALPGA